jgi:hypothetical protein
MGTEKTQEPRKWTTPQLSRYGTFAEATKQQVKARGRGDQFVPDILTPFFTP